MSNAHNAHNAHGNNPHTALAPFLLEQKAQQLQQLQILQHQQQRKLLLKPRTRYPTPPKRGVGGFAFVHNDGYEADKTANIVNTKAMVGRVIQFPVRGNDGKPIEAKLRWYTETSLGSRVYTEYSPFEEELETWTIPLSGLTWLEMGPFSDELGGHKLGYHQYQEMMSQADSLIRRGVPIPESVTWPKLQGDMGEGNV
eukprot:CAMPEP_0197542286 /NCGR_PEP_ID=MMETSP1318-20131121/67623_1 /TAXON_ID=552666 /ORGANISM="Partenskyella glossopodia, Strain RCC365" /LENGTH=197 /DNA_ID=CAMNT_0043101539 /DNA_START=427 /DNA_END=1020 /DNA_ORIENTATION=-